IENARLFQEAIEKQKMEDDLKIAREIQQGLLPRVLPHIEGFDLAATNVSSKQVGGDYYDVVQRDENDYVIAIGDVSGKGTPAALLMANVQAALRAIVPLEPSLSLATARINDLLCLNTGQDKFITFFWGILHWRDRTFRFVNAGHNQPFLIRENGQVKRLEEGGLILGMLATSTPYEEGFITLNKGDALILFTDGVSEAMNAFDEDFTEERLEEILIRARNGSALEILNCVLTEIESYSRGTPQSDDLTLVVLKAL
ncbi:MAG: PP2C family protein-serine/threonine phosphatase, partial [Bacteroidota bacterium]